MDLPGRRLGVAIPGQIRMSLRTMKNAHEPVVVGLAGMVQEQLATRLAGTDPAETCKKCARNMQLFVKNMHNICKNI